ncbi:MAG: 4-hydroxy-3-methylbut-2-enyl diphosphate reductase [Neisseriaceae bacterium]|nr:4-hydroxy-3-methylbut-2-enyl diphosphate reductase [Neisseriaceae bacterium]MBQ9260002.1 4-hydroxy-3-methylbut-2-enyl diphosphate reductase [Neisseriaceae bacterium]
MKSNTKTITLANPRGFCAGVDRAINIVEKALAKHGAPIFVRHEVVHNRFVVDNLKAKGVVFIEDLDEVPQGAVLIYSAHGVSLKVQKEAEQRGFQIYDATCPLVTKVHKEVQRLSQDGVQIVMIGHKGHPEVEGTMGQVANNMLLVETVADVALLQVKNPEKLAFVSQTTLSVDETADIVAALRDKFPHIISPKKNDICYATQNRQDAVKHLADDCDLLIVVGSPNSSNSNRLRETAAKRGVCAVMIDHIGELDTALLSDKHHIGITAGASAPEILVQELVKLLISLGYVLNNQNEQPQETISFVLPKALRDSGKE